MGTLATRIHKGFAYSYAIEQLNTYLAGANLLYFNVYMMPDGQVAIYYKKSGKNKNEMSLYVDLPGSSNICKIGKI